MTSSAKIYFSIIPVLLGLSLSAESMPGNSEKKSCQVLFNPKPITDFISDFIVKNQRLPSIDEVPNALKDDYRTSLYGSPKPQELDVDQLTDLTSQFLIKNGRAPNVTELAEKANVPEEQLKKFFARKSSPQILGLVALAKQKDPKSFQKFEKEYAKFCAKFLKEHSYFPTPEEVSNEMKISISDLNDIYGAAKGAHHRVMEYFPEAYATAADKIIDQFAALAKELERTPTLEELAEKMEISFEQVQTIISEKGVFLSLEELNTKAQLAKAKDFINVLDTFIYNKARLDRMISALKTKERFLLVQASPFKPLHTEAFEALLKMAEEIDAEIIIYPAAHKTTGLDQRFLNTPKVHILTHSVIMNEFVQLNSIPIQDKQIKPSTGLNRYFDRQQIQIIGSPKLEVDSTATLHNDIAPTRTITTGSITMGDYQGKHYTNQRTDHMAREGHVIGALLLEKTHGSEKLINFQTLGDFHMRHLEYIEEKKGFADLNKFYTAEGLQKHQIKAVAMGDIHVGATDPKLLKSYERQIFELKPEQVIIHDLLDGLSISHHEKDKLVSMADKFRKGVLNLREELDNVIGFLNSLIAMDPKLVLVIASSNHNDWLTRWLEAGNFSKEIINAEIGSELQQLMLEEKKRGGTRSPLELYLSAHISSPNKLRFPTPAYGYKRGPDYRLVELGQHGHAGANGAKNSLLSFLRGVGRGVYGHSHTYARYNGAVNIGTSTFLRANYNAEGFSNWSQSLALVGENGEIQVLEFRNNEWYRPLNDQQKIQPEEFFDHNYPVVVPNHPTMDEKLYQLKQ